MVQQLRAEMLQVNTVAAAVPLVTVRAPVSSLQATLILSLTWQALFTLLSAGPSAKGQPTSIGRILVEHATFYDASWTQGQQVELGSLLGPFFRAGTIFDITRQVRYAV